MCSLSLPASIIHQINKYLRSFFWRKYGQDQGGSPLIAWNKVCKPKDKGGLGIIDIALHNKTLLIKNIQRMLNKENIPWINLIWESYYNNGPPDDKLLGSFWWKAHISLFNIYKQHTQITAHKGDTI